MLSPLISLSLSNEDALHHPVIASLVIVALQIAKVRVEEWPREKEPEGSTVGSNYYDNNWRKLGGLSACLQLVTLGQCFVAWRSPLPQRFGRTDLML